MLPKLLYADPKQLQANPWNTNVVPPENEAKIDASIQRHGMFKPLIVRELPGGKLQILGGAHRRDSAIRLGIEQVPIFNLGPIDDKKAKEIGIIDNGRYGDDDSLMLANLLGELGTMEELSTFMPYSDSDLSSIFSSVNIALDDLDLPDEDTIPTKPAEKPVQTHVVMRFKVPPADAAKITERIEKVMKTQRFTEEDSLSNAGNALVHIFSSLDKS